MSDFAKGLRIGLFGFYDQENFGDELMAVIFSKGLSDLGYRTLLLTRKSERFAGFGIECESETKKFVTSVDVCVLGGGGIFIPRASASGTFSGYHDRIRELLECSAASRTSIFALSAGGYGLRLEQIEPEIRRNFLRSCRGVTFRLRQDFEALGGMVPAAAVYPDVVWAVPKIFNPVKKVSDKKRIGINAELTGIDREIFKGLIGGCCLRKDLEFVFISVETPKSPPPLSGLLPGDKVKYRSIAGVRDGLELISGLDLFVTNRLHAGLVALSLQIPTVAFRPEAKVVLEYRNRGLSDCVLSQHVFCRLLGLLCSSARRRHLLDFQRSLDRQGLADGALKHFEFLDRQLSRTS